MADPGFYQSTDANKTINALSDKEKELSIAMEAWEAAQMAVEEAGIEG